MKPKLSTQCQLHFPQMLCNKHPTTLNKPSSLKTKYKSIQINQFYISQQFSVQSPDVKPLKTPLVTPGTNFSKPSSLCHSSNCTTPSLLKQRVQLVQEKEKTPPKTSKHQHKARYQIQPDKATPLQQKSLDLYLLYLEIFRQIPPLLSLLPSNPNQTKQSKPASITIPARSRLPYRSATIVKDHQSVTYLDCLNLRRVCPCSQSRRQGMPLF